MIDISQGLDERESYSEGAMLSSKNISFLKYPFISAGFSKADSKISFDEDKDFIKTGKGLVAHQKSGEGRMFYFLEEKEGEVLKWNGLSIKDFENPPEAVSCGNYIMTFPHKLCLNLENEGTKTFKSADNSYTTQSIGDIYISSNKIKCKTSTTWIGLYQLFKAGDVLTINGKWYIGSEEDGELKDFKCILRDFNYDEKTLIFDPNTFFSKSGDYVMGITEFKKYIPDLKNITSASSRLWGHDEKGKIYASKFGDPTNFEYFNLTAQDSFTLETDTSGEFTASCAFGDGVLFFKEDKIHRITGTKPQNFRHTVQNTMGVKKNCAKSLLEKDGIFYYMGKDGIYCYSGGDAIKISDSLKLSEVVSATAVIFSNTYYICIQEKDKSSIYGFDIEKGIWFKDEKESFDYGFYYLGKTFVKEDGKMKELKKDADKTRDMEITFRPFYKITPEKQGFIKFYINATLSGGKLIVMAEDENRTETLGVFTNERQKFFEVFLKPNRKDEITLKLIASPSVIIKGITKEYFDYDL